MIDAASSLPPGVLRDIHLTGALSWGDVHVAQKLAHLFGEPDQRVHLALALTVRALRAGATCLELAAITHQRFEADEEFVGVPAELWPPLEGWLAAIRASPLVGLGEDSPGVRPLRLVGGLLYLERYWQEESTVAAALTERLARAIDLPNADLLEAAATELLAATMDPDQRVAAVVPSLSAVSVIAGGPGTGKTYTLARVLAMLWRTRPTAPRIALAAPTGKAAARMEEALAEAVADLPVDLQAHLAGLRATTVHRLLGWVPESRMRFQHHRANPLPQDVVIVDEASMVSVTLMARLLDALRPGAALVLIGDPDQLAPVEAGAVLADIVEADPPTAPGIAAPLTRLGLPPGGPIIRLRHNHRSVPAIADLAGRVLAGDVQAALSLATSSPGITFASRPDDTDLAERTVTSGRALISAARVGDATGALAELDRHRLLCGHRRGPFGVTAWAHLVEDWLVQAVGDFDPHDPWYLGRPVLITQNSPDLGLYNGDTGVVVAHGADRLVHFTRGSRQHTVPPYLLEGVQSVHAMTVHKAQGSQFEEVSLVLPPVDSPLLTQELLYTAITRAKSRLTVIGSPEALAQAVRNRARRASGLRQRLRQRD